MSSRRPHTILLALVFGSAVSCSLAVSVSDIDRGCGAGRKWCDDTCVDVNDPAYGCNADKCEPCPLTNAIAGCNELGCFVRSCVKGFAACTTDDSCLTNVLTDSKNCGACKQACDTAAGQRCLAGVCGVPAL